MHNLLKHTSLTRQFELRQAAFKPNMDIQLTPPYRVDAVIERRYIPPDEDNCITMECFDLPKWQKTHFQEARCDCEDYAFDYLTCTHGTGDYDNADGQDQDTNVSVCDDPNVVCGTIDPYENACFDVTQLDAPVVCL